VTVAGHDHARAAYDAFAPAYDRFTAHHDQAGWTGLVLELAVAAGLAGTRVLDVGCGTASAVPPMLERGYAVTGVDISPAMIALGREKVAGRAALEVADMRALPDLGEFDLVWALCDAVNYLLSGDELVAAFAGMRRNLAPGGVVAFDVDSLATMRALYSSTVLVPGADEVVVFEGAAADDADAGACFEAALSHLHRDDAGPFWTRTACVHRQRHHDAATVLSALRSAGMRCVAIWGIDAGGRPERPFDDGAHNKAVYIARVGAP
jgi:SAM-dependent methyltransferase